MTNSLLEIATDLATQYPFSSAQQIADVMIGAIESGSVVSKAISYVKIPTQLQLKQAEFKSRRLPRKRVSKDETNRRELLLDHIDNVKLLRQLKMLNNVPIEDAGPGPIIGLDGGRVALSSSFQGTGATYQPVRNLLSAYGTRQNVSSVQNVSKSTTTDASIHSLPSRSIWETTFSPLEFITEVEKDPTYLLTMHDIYRIVTFLYLYSDDYNLINRIDEVTRNDVKSRNRKSKSDCIKELYRADDQVQMELRVAVPKDSDYLGIMNQRIRAIIIDEYSRLQSQVAQKFTSGEISYEHYVQAENKYANFANELMANLP